MQYNKYVVECYPKGWDEPFRREYFDSKDAAKSHAMYKNIHYPIVIVVCEVYDTNRLGVQDSYQIFSTKAAK